MRPSPSLFCIVCVALASHGAGQVPRWRLVQTHVAPTGYTIWDSNFVGFGLATNTAGETLRLSPDGTSTSIAGVLGGRVFNDGSVFGYSSTGSSNTSAAYWNEGTITTWTAPSAETMWPQRSDGGAVLMVTGTAGIDDFWRGTSTGLQYLGTSADKSINVVGDNNQLGGAILSSDSRRLPGIWDENSTVGTVLNAPGLTRGHVTRIASDGRIIGIGYREGVGYFRLEWNQQLQLVSDQFILPRTNWSDPRNLHSAHHDAGTGFVVRGQFNSISEYREYYWSPTTGAIPLESLVEGIEVGGRIDLVQRSQVDGRLSVILQDSMGRRGGYHLVPVPEPMSLSALGLGLLALGKRPRKSANR